jgi:hypothetical protein
MSDPQVTRYTYQVDVNVNQNGVVWAYVSDGCRDIDGCSDDKLTSNLASRIGLIILDDVFRDLFGGTARVPRV